MHKKAISRLTAPGGQISVATLVERANVTDGERGSDDPRFGKINGVLRQAEQAMRSEGIDTALICLCVALFVTPHHQQPLTDAERIAMLEQFVLKRDPKTALQLARYGLTLDDMSADIWQLTGNVLEKLGAPEARQVFEHILKLSGARPEHVLNAALAIARTGKFNAAEWTAALQAFDALGKPSKKVGQLLYLAQKAADRKLLSGLTGQLQAAYAHEQFDEAPEVPRSHINWCFDERWNLQLIRRWSQRTFSQITKVLPKLQSMAGRRLRVGYLSSDFREHPTSRLVNGLFRHHDRSRIELFMYCSGWDDGSALRREVMSHFEHFHSVGRLSDADAATLIQSHNIDVLVELNGPTWANRMDILAHRPAPVQINYLGWLGSIGGRVVDAIVADCYVVPSKYESLYPEKIIYLPDTYQVNDYSARSRPARLSRTDARLPEGDWRILGAFNGVEKLHGAVWQAWMAILNAVPNALLWLLDPAALRRKIIWPGCSYAT